MKIFIFDPIWDKLITNDLTSQLSSLSADIYIKKEVDPLSECKELFKGDDERILCINPDYVSWKLNSDSYKDIPNLKAILPASTSVSWIDLSHANKQGIAICNIKGFSTESVAEWAISMMFSVARQIPMLIKSGFPLDYDKDYLKYRGLELKGKKAGILGLGAIGTAIADRCNGLGMEVFYWSKNSRSNKYKFLELSEIASSVDVLFPTMVVNEESKSILSNEIIKTMHNQAILISIVHNLFDHKLIVEMVKQNKLFGYGYESSPSNFNNYEGNIWAAPAYAWATNSSMNRSMKFWIQNIINASKGEYLNRIN